MSLFLCVSCRQQLSTSLVHVKPDASFPRKRACFTVPRFNDDSPALSRDVKFVRSSTSLLTSSKMTGSALCVAVKWQIMTSWQNVSVLGKRWNPHRPIPEQTPWVVTSTLAVVGLNTAWFFLKTGTNRTTWPYPTHEAGSWPLSDPPTAAEKGVMT